MKDNNLLFLIYNFHIKIYSIKNTSKSTQYRRSIQNTLCSMLEIVFKNISRKNVHENTFKKYPSQGS